MPESELLRHDYQLCRDFFKKVHVLCLSMKMDHPLTATAPKWCQKVYAAAKNRKTIKSSLNLNDEIRSHKKIQWYFILVLKNSFSCKQQDLNYK